MSPDADHQRKPLLARRHGPLPTAYARLKVRTMPNRRKIRELALQVLFAWDAHGQACDEMASQVTHDGTDDPLTRQQAVVLARGAWEWRQSSDPWVERLAPQWPPRRQPAVDRNLLRLAIYELTSTDTPARVVLDEAIELAKLYSTEHSPSFINGVLDAVLREHRSILKQPTEI
jgi:N utilization substance protein B